MTRHECRIIAMKLLFSSLDNENFDFETTQKELLLDINATDEDVDFINQIYQCAKENEIEIISKLSQTLKGYEWGRIYKVDKCLLILALAEMSELKITPPKIVISEILNIAKEYSTPNSAKFINGILANFVGEV